MVPLLLLKKDGTQRGRLAGWRRCLQAALVVLGIAFLGLSAQAQTFVTNITRRRISTVGFQTKQTTTERPIPSKCSSTATSPAMAPSAGDCFNSPHSSGRIRRATSCRPVCHSMCGRTTREPEMSRSIPDEEVCAGYGVWNLPTQWRDLVDL